MTDIRSPDLGSAFTTEMATASRKARKLFDGFVRKRGLTLSRARALLLLSAHPNWNQTELADALDIEYPSVVRLLDGLEQQRLIARIAVKGDRRAKNITLTKEAKAQVQEVENISARVRAILLRGIDPSEMEIAFKVLQQVVNNVASAKDVDLVDHHDGNR